MVLSLKRNDLKSIGIIKTFLKSYPLIKIKLFCYLIFKNPLERF